MDGQGRMTGTRRIIAGDRVLVQGAQVLNTRNQPRDIHEDHESTGLACASAPPGVPTQSLRYDAIGRTLEVIHADGATGFAASVQATEYRPLSRITWDEEDTANASTSTPATVTEDGLGRMVRQEQRASATGPVLVTQTRYDALGRVAALVAPDGFTRFQQHDLLGRVVRAEDEAAGATTYQHDAAGNVTRVTDATGRVTATTYDELNRPLQIEDPADAANTRVTYAYDRTPGCAGDPACEAPAHMLASTFPGGQDRLHYNNRLLRTAHVRTVDSHELRVETSYDNAGRAIRKAFTGGIQLDYVLDGLGRITSIPGVITSNTFDARGLLSGRTHANGMKVGITADARRRVTRMAASAMDGSVLFGQALTLDRTGNVLRIRDELHATLGTSADYEYDGLKRLVRAHLDPEAEGGGEVIQYRYDTGDNLLEKTSSLGPGSPCTQARTRTRPDAVPCRREIPRLRFYVLAPALFAFLEQLQTSPGNPALDVAEAYFGRLIRASSQKTRAWSEVARRYQGFNRPDLARRAIERAYTGAYLESVILSRMMMRLIGTAGRADRAQIIRNAEQAQRLYRAALLDMRDVYSDITEDVNFFGFEPDYIPFPALEPQDPHAFGKALRMAQQRLAVARDKEQTALNASRGFDTDEASFQSELTGIRNNYERQLGDLCGYFTGNDGNTYPQIRKYAHLGAAASMVGDPCGVFGGGAINDAIVALETRELEFQAMQLGYDNIVSRIEIERDRVNAQCDLTLDLAKYRYNIDGEVLDLQKAISASRTLIDKAEYAYKTVSKAAKTAKCLFGAGQGGVTDSCKSAVATTAVFLAASAAVKVTMFKIKDDMKDKQKKIAKTQAALAKWETQRQCDAALIDSDATVKELLLALEGRDLDALRGQYELSLAQSHVEQLRHQAARLEAEQEEAEQLAINVQAARNNPNVRIYKNDAIITADRTFQAALREAYKATKVYEYYTSQSYAGLQKLFLTRMVSAGDFTLEQYLFELEDAFLEFQEDYGLPDNRVEIISLRDDILKIPRLDDAGAPLGAAARVALFRDALKDPARVDPLGHLNFPFSTTTGQLSPLARNHKIQHVEAEYVGADTGDTVGRVYLRQVGTGTLTALEGRDAYYAFPERTAVVNALFNGQRMYAPQVYQSARLRDMPVANSRWELAINQRDEAVNQDINLQSLTDVRLYIYYSDFTAE